MTNVGIKDLKAKLSEYVTRVRAGERIVITDRGAAVAELVPLSPERQQLVRLAEQGHVQWSGGRPKGLAGVTVRGEPVAETVLAERE